jgi:ABC-type glycerol-3-phosphate transport system substrate-binding protein
MKQQPTCSRARASRSRGGVRARRRVLGSLGLAGAFAFGCGAPAPGCESEEPCRVAGPLELATWWGTRGELYASFDILKQSYQQATHREIELVHQLQNKRDHTLWVEQQMSAPAAGAAPLDVFSANNGDEVLRWTPCAAWGTPPAEPRLVGLTSPALGALHLQRDWIDTTFEPRVMETLQCEGETYALPVGIHRINTLFFNKALFRAAGYAVDGGGGTPLPASLPELHEAAARVAMQLPDADPASQLRPSAFAVAGREAWTISLFFIENVMLALAGNAERYENYWRGAACDVALLQSALDEFSRLRAFFGSAELNSSEARERVQNGQAAMMVMGDWATAELDPRLVGSMPFPGTAQYFVFSADVFALPALDTSSPANGLGWLRSVTERQTQQQFSVAKSALPARVDLQGEQLGAREAPLAWVRSLPALLPYGPTAPFASLQDELRSWLSSADGSGDALLEYTREQYPMLSGGAVTCPSADGSPSVDIPEIQ